MDRIEILTRLALILRRMDRLAGLDIKGREDLHQTQDEINRLREKWQELTQELKRMDRPRSLCIT
jgi:predicted  nucleic acid-binding Zn-ribbon protein